MHQMGKGMKRFSNQAGKICVKRKDGLEPAGKEATRPVKNSFFSIRQI